MPANLVPPLGDRHVGYRYLQRALVVLLAIRLVWSVISGAGFYWDFVNFYDTGARMFHGDFEHLYSAATPIAGQSASVSARFAYTGFPLSAFAFAPLGALAPRWALLAFKLASALCFGLGLFVIYRYCADRYGPAWDSDVALTFFLLLVLLFEPLWFVFAVGGQATPIAFLLLALFAASYMTDRLWVAAICLSLAVLIKPLLALTVALFVAAAAWPLLIRLGCCFAVEGAVSLLVFGWQRHLEWMRMLLSESSRWAVPWWNNSSILGAAANFWLYRGSPTFGSAPVPRSLRVTDLIFQLSLAIVFVAIVRRGRHRSWAVLEQRQHHLLLALLFPLFVSGVIWPHYLVFVLLPLLVLIAQYRQLPALCRFLLVITVLSTIRGNTALLRTWPMHSSPEILVASLIGSGTLLLMLVLSVAYGDFLRACSLARR